MLMNFDEKFIIFKLMMLVMCLNLIWEWFGEEKFRIEIVFLLLRLLVFIMKE